MSDDAGILDMLRACGLLRADERASMTPLAGGVSCDVWKVAAEDGRRFVVKQALPQLRVEAEWFAPIERAESEVRWLKRAHDVNARLSPEILWQDADRHLFVMTYLDPASHPVWKDELIAGRIDTSFAGAVGRDLARIHAATARDRSIAQDFDTAALFDALRIDPFLRFVAEQDPLVAPRLHALAGDLAGCRIALVHGDVSPKNILVGPDGPVFLDAECAVHGDPAFDLAFCITHLLLKSIWLKPYAPALIASATAMAAAYRADIDWEHAETLSRRSATLVAALLLARIDGKSLAAYLSDEHDRMLIRERARTLLTGPDTTLEQLIAGWMIEDNQDEN